MKCSDQTEIIDSKERCRSGNEIGHVEDWRVGRNPPFVLGDIHLIGIPAPLAEVTSAYYPFHDAGWHFTLTASLLNASASSSRADRGIFLRLNPTSRSTLRSATLPPRGWSFLRPQREGPESPTNSPTQPLQLPFELDKCLHSNRIS